MNVQEDEDVVTTALRKARYNEIVHICIDTSGDVEDDGDPVNCTNDDTAASQSFDTKQTPSAKTKTICLIPRLNEQQGGVQFMNLVDLVNRENSTNQSTESPDDDCATTADSTTIILQRELQTKRWFFPMLNDTRRNQCYYTAIAKAIEYVMKHHRREEEPTIQVLDIGSGSGLLSMMVAREYSKYCSNETVKQKSSTTTTTTATTSVIRQRLPTKLNIASVEMSTAFGTLAQWTLEENTTGSTTSILNLDSHKDDDDDDDANCSISIHPGQHSTSLTFNASTDKDRSIQYDVCISELFDHGLFGEGWIPTIRDAWSRHMSSASSSSRSLMIPCGAKVYGAIVQSSWMNDYCRPLHTPYEFTTVTSGDGAQHHSLSLDLKNNNDNQYLIDTCHVLLPIHINKLVRDKKIAIVSNSELIFNIDVTAPSATPTLDGQTNTVTFTIDSCSTDGDIKFPANPYGVLVWWDMILWKDHDHDGSDVIYSLQPNEQQPFQDHWCPCLHLLPSSSNTIPFNNGAAVSVDVTFRHDDCRVYVETMQLHSTDSVEEGSRMKKLKSGKNEERNDPVISSSLPPAYISQERSYQLNDRQRMRILQEALENAIQYKMKQRDSANSLSTIGNSAPLSNNIIIVDVSDFALGACIATTMCHTMTQESENSRVSIISVENSAGQLPALASLVLSNSIPTKDPSKRVETTVLQCYNENITLGAIGDAAQPADIVFSEPYYEVLEGWHLQEALNFYYTVRLLRSNGIISQETVVLPGTCRILGCIVESPDLRNAYGPCGDSISESIHGIQHKCINHIGRDGRGHDMSMAMWQYDYKVLSNSFELGALQYMDPNAPIIPEAATVVASFHTPGHCDALLVWLEYSFALQASNDITNSILSTDCQSYKQTIIMLDYNDEVSNVETAQVLCHATFGGDKFESHRFDVHIRQKCL